MKVERIVPGTIHSPDLVGAVIVRDLQVGGERWAKGRRLSAGDLERLAAATAAVAEATGGAPARPATGAEPSAPGLPASITVLRLEAGDVHEDDAAAALARVVAGPGLRLRGPAESRVDLIAIADGIAHVRAAAVERLDRIDPLAVFAVFDGQAVRSGDVVASVKVGPHVVDAATLAAGLRVAGRASPLVRVAAFRRRTVAAIVKQSVHAIARERFESSVRAKVESLGSVLEGFHYVADDAAAVEAAFGELIGRVDVILTAGGASTDPTDPLFVAIERCGGRVVRHGVPAHPGSMVFLARVGRSDVLGLPTCGAYSKATAADLLLPRLLTGERASAAMASALGHGGLLSRSMRFRFPPYARDLDAPDG